MAESRKQWENNPELLSIIDKYRKIDKGDWKSIKKVSGEFITEAVKQGMPSAVADCCGFSLVEGGAICPQCEKLLENA